MSVVTIFSAAFCNQDQVVQDLISDIGYQKYTDAQIAAEAARLSGMEEAKIHRCFSAKTSAFNRFTHEKERSVAWLRLALATMLAKDGLLFSGFCGLLVPNTISHVLRVCLIADLNHRIALATREKGVGDREAQKIIHRCDEDAAAWTDSLFGQNDPWHASLYDIVIPVNTTSAAAAAALIGENLQKSVLRPNESSRQAVDDFLLAARVEVALASEGHNVLVAADHGKVTLTINKNVLMLSRLEDELKSIAAIIPGVQMVQTRVGKNFHQADIYRKYDFQAPSKVLLVDDEREFVQSLSERLILREMGSAVAYDGASALHMVREDDPEVMILDLKMPGIDGIDVLRQVKATRPDIEVIILTGQGAEADRQICMSLGAFAYLEKPVDINRLSEVLREANEKVRKKKAGSV